MLLILLLSFTFFTTVVQCNGVGKTDTAWQNAMKQEGMHMGKGRMKRYVQLDGEQTDVTYEVCELPNGKQGLCKPPYLCMKEEYMKNFITFTENVCILNKKIGVCCPKSDSLGPQGLAGDLPAVAAKNEASMGGSETRGCGLSTRSQTTSTGSHVANPREWPWMASITPPGFEQYCGGVLITDRHVLTAAHCTRRWKPQDLQVRLGEYDFRRTNDSRSYNFKVVDIRQHELYDHSSYWNDIAILKLHRPAVFNTYVWPICLPPIGINLVNETGYIIGWGTQKYKGTHSTVLMEVSVPIWDLQTCMDSFTDSVFEENICAGAYEGGRDACQGDSGGPLMYQMASGRWTVVGVVSWGVRCGEAEHPGLYTRVDNYLTWIIANTQY